MKISKIVFVSIAILLFFANSLFAVTTNEVPTAYSMRMPIGGAVGNDLNRLSIDSFASRYPKIRFNVDGDSIPEQNEWYVATAFNHNKWLNVKWNSDSTDWYTKRHYHPGDDWNETTGGRSDEGEPIYAIADGVVLKQDFNKDFGNYIIIVHKTLWGEFVVSFYAHMRDSALYSIGKPVNSGWIIGYIGDSGSPGNWHLHFEIRRQSALKIDPDSKEISFSTDCPALCWPKTSAKIQKYYYNPSQFIKTYNTVGKSADGTFNNEIHNAYTRNGGYKNLGIPFNNGGSIYVHNWQGIVIQDLQHPDCPNGICLKPKPATASYHGDDGQTAIIYNQEKYRAYLVRDGFWGIYKILGSGLIGPPTSEEYPSDYNGSVRQDFKFVYMVWDKIGITVYANSGQSMFHYDNDDISGRKTIQMHFFGCKTFANCSKVDQHWNENFKVSSNTVSSSTVSANELSFFKTLYLASSFSTLSSLFIPANAYAQSTTGEITVFWKNPVDPSLDYQIEIYRDDGLAFVKTAGVSTLIDSGLVSGKEYCYQLKFVVSRELSSTLSDTRCAVAQTPENPIEVPEYVFSKAVMAISADQFSPYMYSDERSIFSEGDSVVYWIELNNVNASVGVKVKVYQPDNNLFLENDFGWTSDPGTGTYGWYRLFFTILNIGDYEGCYDMWIYREGQWSAELYVDDGSGYKLINTKKFAIQYDQHASTWYKDIDNDEYSDGVTLSQCTRPFNHKLESEIVSTFGDCNDNDFFINQGITEICDGVDNNCKNGIDEGCFEDTTPPSAPTNLRIEY